MVDKVQVTMRQDQEHLRVEMRRTQAVMEEGANRGHISAPYIQVESKVWLDAPNIRTTQLNSKLDWKRLGPFQECSPVSPYNYETELPASIQIH